MKKLAEKIIVTLVVLGFFMGAFWILLQLFGYISRLGNDEKREAFLYHNQEFLCRGGFERFLVSQTRGWKIQGDEFIKEDKVVPIEKCQERE